MIESQDPYSPPRSKLGQPSSWWLGLTFVYLSALAAIICLYFALERYYFADGKTDPAMFVRALPQLAIVAIAPALLSTAFRPRRLWSQLCFGFALGPLFGCIAFATYNYLAATA